MRRFMAPCTLYESDSCINCAVRPLSHRIHQFEKLEQFCITSPEATNSWEAMDEMLGNAEDFYQV